jgi:hypothetical protein
MTNTEKIVLLNEAAAYMARVWKQVLAPVQFSHSFYINGVWVSVSIGYDPERLDKPKRRAEDAMRSIEEQTADSHLDG